jgi:hypothetical protein
VRICRPCTWSSSPKEDNFEEGRFGRHIGSSWRSINSRSAVQVNNLLSGRLTKVAAIALAPGTGLGPPKRCSHFVCPVSIFPAPRGPMMIDVQNVIRGRLLYPSAHNAHMHMSHSNGFMYDVRSVEASVYGQSSTIHMAVFMQKQRLARNGSTSYSALEAPPDWLGFGFCVCSPKL